MGPRTSPRGRWFTLFFEIVIVLEMVTFAGANSDGDPMGEPAAGLLCISDCVTCPSHMFTTSSTTPLPSITTIPPLSISSTFLPLPSTATSTAATYITIYIPRRRLHHHLHHHQPIIHHRSRHKHRHGILYGALLHLLVIISTLLRAKHPLERDRTPILTTTSTPQRPLLFSPCFPFLFTGGLPCCLLAVLVEKLSVWSCQSDGEEFASISF
ncbi:hypothetical protein OIU76_009022 [Salix suchowensis]|nr:hypothetical protein OIU76_009022 [Salix suchowensis]